MKRNTTVKNTNWQSDGCMTLSRLEVIADEKTSDRLDFIYKTMGCIVVRQPK